MVAPEAETAWTACQADSYDWAIVPILKEPSIPQQCRVVVDLEAQMSTPPPLSKLALSKLQRA